MSKKRTKILSWFVISVFFFTSFSRITAYSYDGSTSAPAGTTQVTTTEKVQSTYGPYSDDNTSSKAYDPFEKQKDSEPKLLSENYKKDTLLIKVKDKSSGTSSLQSDPSNLGLDSIVNLKPLFKVEPDAQNSQGSLQSIDTEPATWYSAQLVKGTDIKDAMTKVLKQPGVVAAEPDYLRSIKSDGIPDGSQDEKMAEQWYLDRCGIKDAWQYLGSQGINPGGKRDVVVAVIDTGVDTNNTDLKGNLWTNTREIPGNGIDDDGNGYVDDVNGANTISNNGNILDDNGHGTHVAGIIGAQNNNGGIVGVAYNVQIMPIKAAQSSGVLTSSDIARAIYYAASNGADVINMSFGGYGQSTIEEDALQVAFGTSVLVAAAGNDGVHNDPRVLVNGKPGQPMYPGAYPWVLGVMAESQTPAPNGDNLAYFSNWDVNPQDSYEYEVMAPGTEILSTLPGGSYAKWSGTSMATPIVAGIAALVRSKYTDKDVYSSRFIMGQIASTGVTKQGITYSNNAPPTMYKEVNAINALTNVPKPSLSYIEHYLFDKKDISSANNGDGVVDAGETIDLGMIIRNHWGKADNVKITVDTKSNAGIDDPYVSFVNGTNVVDYGAVGTFATDDNGLIYDNDVITGVQHPCRIKIADNTPNDHVVPIHLTITATNGFDPTDPTVYTTKDSFNFIVRNGQVLPGEITSDMTLTKEKYWIIPNATVIDQGVTVKVEPGTQIQFWSSQPEDPYAEKPMAYLQVKGKFIATGTAEEPIQMFASGLYPGFEVRIYNSNNSATGDMGYSELNYVRLMNPILDVSKIDHCYFSQDLDNHFYIRWLNSGAVQTSDYTNPYINCNEVTNTRFYKLGYAPWQGYNLYFRLNGISKGNLFDSCLYLLTSQYAENNVYLKNYKLLTQQFGDRTYAVSNAVSFGNQQNLGNSFMSVFPVKFNNNGSTYITVKPNINISGKDEIKLVEEYAKELGGHIATINDAEENNFLTGYLNNYVLNPSLFNSQYPNFNFMDFYYPTYVDAAVNIGLNDFSQEGKYEWISGESSNYTNWDSGEPNNSSYNYNYNKNISPSNFVCLNRNGKWIDSSTSNRPYIIEIPGTSYVTGISLDKQTMDLGAGGASAKLTATIAPVKATNKNIIWTSSNPDVASVDTNGTVSPLSIGTADITATTEDGGFAATCKVTVRQIVNVTGITLDKSYIKLAAGGKATLTPSMSPANVTDNNVKWESSDNSVATVDDFGNVTAVSEGSAVIKATAEDGGYTAECNVQVVVPVVGISLDNRFLRMVVDDAPVKLNAAITPANASIKLVKWSSSNEAVVTVDSNGTITPVGTGTALITGTTSDGGFNDSCIVTVWDHAVSFAPTYISAGAGYASAINEDGTLWSWGNNGYYNLGDGSNISRNTPVQVNNLQNVISVSNGYTHTAAVTSDGSVWTWGSSWSGALGGGIAYQQYNSPVKLNNISDIKDVKSGYDFTLALSNDGTVWAWGRNESGQLGDGTNTSHNFPVQVPNLTDVKEIYTGYSHSVALKNDGTVWTWGNNDSGQLGDGTSNNNRNTLAQVGGLTNVKDICAGAYYTIALKNDGSVWGFGSIPYYGGYNNPVQIQGLSNIKAIAAANAHLLFLKNNGIILSIGYNQCGQLGDGTTNYSYSPVQVKNLSSVESIAANGSSSYAITSDGKVWAWGDNSYGQLGDLTKNNSSIPVQTLFGILPDTDAPVIQADKTTVTSDSAVTIVFNEGVKAFLNYGVITFRDTNGKNVTLKEKTISGSRLTLKPLNTLIPGQTYNICIPSNSVSDMFSNGLANDYNFSFTFNTSGSTISKLSSLQDITPAADITKPILSADEIEAKRKEFVKSDTFAEGASTIKNNAILNCWWDGDVSHWLRFTGNDVGDGSIFKRYLTGNYWGVTSDTLIGKAIVDYNDFKSLEEIIYKPILTTPPESAYPFVTDISVSAGGLNNVTKVGAETITVNVSFNRDMNTNVQPQVSFGPDMPTTDYTVHPINGGWTNPRLWVGSFNITPITGDGYQFFRVAGAVAADDPWLVTGNDSERYRFEIITSGTESMNLQASGAEGKISLSWTQNDFDTLAGYNIYRSTSINGVYTKINSTVIPNSQLNYDDTDVTPGATYYYKFKVVKTDMTESDFSNVAAAQPYDTIPPVITHNPVKIGYPGLQLNIDCDATDNVAVKEVNLYFRKTGTTTYTKLAMVKTTGSHYSANIEGSKVGAPGIDYYIEATDGITIVRNGTADKPNNIVVSDSPKITSISPTVGSSDGGTTVTIMGTNFKNGAKVTIGGAAASNVVVVSANKITATTPAHDPGTVDVVVINSDGNLDTYLNGFTYSMDGVEASIPSIKESIGHTFDVPINITQVEGLKAANIKLTFDKDVLKVNKVSVGNITSGFTILANNTIPGEVNVGMSSATSITGKGVLMYVTFEVLNTQKTSSSITLDTVALNDDAIKVNKVNGQFTMAQLYNVKGNITYYNGGAAVPGVTVNLNGNKTSNAKSASDGTYTISGVEQGDYTLTADKSDDVKGITAYDASLILQASVGLITLNDNQKLAADVNKNGSITPMDAADVLSAAVGLTSPPFAGAGRIWTFVPGSTDLKGINADINNQNITGILIGDVSGNWGNTSINGSASNNIVDLRIGSVGTIQNAEIDVPLNVDMKGNNFYSIDTVINYDPNVLTLLDVQKGSALSNDIMAFNAETPGKIRISIAGANPLGGSFTAVNLKFRTNSSITSTQVGFDNYSLQENAVSAEGTAGTINISEYINGDMSRDGRIDKTDYEMIKQYILQNLGKTVDSLALKSADIDKDGVITSRDYALVKKIIRSK